MIIKEIKQSEGSRRILMTWGPAGGVGRGRRCEDEGYLPAEAPYWPTLCTLHCLQTPSPALRQLDWVGGRIREGGGELWPPPPRPSLYHPLLYLHTRAPNETQRLDVVVSLLWAILLLIGWPPADQLTSSWSADLPLITIKPSINCCLLNCILD